MRQGLPYETATAGEKALIDLQRALAKFGCKTFGHMVDHERGATIIQFKWNSRQISLEASWKGYAYAYLKVHPYHQTRMRLTRSEYDKKAFNQAQLSVCSVLRDWVKGQITAVECGIMSFDAAFMPFILLPSGERLIDHVNENLLPPPEEKVVNLKP